jgi:hypothetical protein
MSGSVASSGPATKPYADGADEASTPVSQPAQQPRPATPLPAPTQPAQTVSNRQAYDAPAKLQPMAAAADTSSLSAGNEQEAAGSLNAFLNEYCGRRAGIIGQAVRTTTVTWWPMGAGVVVELDEGGAYRQGTAQYTPKAGWAWLIRPDAMASTGN